MKFPIDRYPGMNRFVLDWMGGDDRFLPRRSEPLPAREVDLERRKSVAKALDASNRHWGIFVRDQLERWAGGDTVTIVAGQQVGFAGGPLYTLAKIATLLRMKRDLEAEGKPVTLFFWLATEDHDFDEVAQLCLPVGTVDAAKSVNRQLDLVCTRAVRSADVHAVVGPLRVPDALVSQLLTLLDADRPGWLREGISFRDSFAELIAQVTGNRLILVDALLPELRAAGAPLFEAIDANYDEVQAALARRAGELEAAGYKEQVAAREDASYTLLYELDEDGSRHPTRHVVDPVRTSTTALTRPLLQDFVLQPDVFVGGPAEVSYYAQLQPLHALLGVPLPRVALRGHVLLAPKRVARTIERFAIAPEEMFSTPEAIASARELEAVARIRALTEEGKADFRARIEKIGELALPADHSLSRAINRSVGHLEYHFDKLAERAIKGVARKDKERHAVLRELVSTLYPDGKVQDRVVGWVSWWLVHGEHLVNTLVDEVEPDRAVVKIAVL
jgi:uncharacterized protein YllA (UPF0747 family)